MSRILIVDDSEAPRSLTSAIVAGGEHELVVVDSGDRAVPAVRESTIDLVLIDIRILVADDFATCRRLRRIAPQGELPIVVMVAAPELDQIERALEAGADDFLLEPLAGVALRLRLRALLRTGDLLRVERGRHDAVCKQRDAIAELARHKDELSAFIVHDLKSPLTSASFAIQNLLLDPSLDDFARKTLEVCLASNEAMGRMVMDLLGLARDGALAPKLAAVDLPATLRGLERTLQPRADNRRVQLAITCEPATVVADGDLLRRTLDNLVDNALRYAPPRTTIDLSARRAPDGVLFRVADRGPGIPVEDRARVFDRFTQLEAGTTRTGRGLGLAFCMAAVEAHGGRIWVDDNHPQGAAFCVLLPDRGQS